MFRLPRKVRELSLRGNLLSGSVLYEMLEGFTKIKSIDIKSNAITDNLRTGIFTGMKDLTYLHMTGCQMSEIPLGLFDGLDNLEHLSLRSNKLKRLHRDIFKNINSTGLDLKLGGNNIEVIEEGTFHNLSFINGLSLWCNKLTTFPDLKGIAARIHSLDLSFNKIADINRIKQSGIKEILQLDLGNNQISTILPDHFKDIKLFEYVSLSNNRIKKIPAGIFNRSSWLNQLILQNNEIETIEKGSFDGMTNLQEVFLFNNSLTSLPDDLFQGLPLRILFLNGNKFDNLTGRPFRGMKKRKTTLYLFSNKVQHIEDDFFSDLGNETTVALRCRSLKDLPYIDKNTLGKILCTPNNLPRLKRLNRNIATSLSQSGFNCTRIRFSIDFNDCECTICQAGTYGNGRIGSGCSKCSAGGFYQDEMGQTQCKNCSIGTFVRPVHAPAQSPLNCMACPRGTRSNENAGFRACKCLQDFYRFDRFGSCMSCPKKGLKCINDYAILTEGYYWVWTNHSSKQIYSDFIYNLNIESDEFVEGTWKYTGTLPKPHKCPRDSCLGGLNSTCKAGYRGLLCAICEPSYFQRMGRCIRCPSKLRAGFEIAGVVVAFVLILLALLWGDKKRILSGRTWADVILSCFKIIVGFYQVMAGLYSCLANIEWPSSVIWMQKALHLIELNVLQFAPLSCLSSYLSFNALQQFVVVIVSNTVVVGIVLIYLAIRIRQHKNKKNSIDIASVAQTRSSCIRNICVFLFATYPKTCTSIFQILSVNCIPLCSHDKQKNCPMYLRSDVSVQCQSPLYDIYSKVALGFLIYPVGFPVVMVLLVWYYVHRPPRGERTTSEVDTSELTSVTEEQRSRVAFRFSFQSGLSLFYENYRPECWYWESVEMARKLLLTSGLTLIGAHSRTQIGLGAIISALFSILYVGFHPISNPFENHLQTIALMAVFLNLGIGVMFNVSDDVIPTAVNQHNDKIGVAMIMIVINSAVVVIVIVKCLKIIIKSLLKWCKTTDKKCSCSHCCQLFGTFCLSLLTPLKLTNNDYRQNENYHTRSNILDNLIEHEH